MPRCYISLGGNVGSVSETFEAALQRLDELDRIHVVGRSRVHRTAPVGAQSGGEFQNAAAALETDLSPDDLLDVLLSVESEFGRERLIRWGPRRLDLDLIFYGDRVIASPTLEVPHSACWYRRFVLEPLAEIAGDVLHPVKGLTVHELLRRLCRRPLRLGVVGGEHRVRTELIAALRADFPAVQIEQWQPGVPDREAEPVLIVWLGPSPGGSAFDALPTIERLDATSLGPDPATAVRDVVQSALGE